LASLLLLLYFFLSDLFSFHSLFFILLSSRQRARQRKARQRRLWGGTGFDRAKALGVQRKARQCFGCQGKLQRQFTEEPGLGLWVSMVEAVSR
jgi:hypothetical protein